MSKAYRLVRDVPQTECKWLSRDYLAGEIVYPYVGHTYGCITSSGTAVSEKQYPEKQEPFFELPWSALEELD